MIGNSVIGIEWIVDSVIVDSVIVDSVIADR